MRYAHRVDDTHAAVKAAFQKVGATVMDLSGVGSGWPDMAVGWRGKSILIECKSKDGFETPEQRERRLAWRGDAWLVVRDPETAVLQVVQAITKGARHGATA